jgi:hypothetical protein
MMDTDKLTRDRQGLLAVYTAEEAAFILGQEVSTLMTWRSKKIGPAYIKAGREIFYSRFALGDWLESKTVYTTESEPQTGSQLVGEAP